MHRPDNRQSVLRFCVADGVPTREQRAGRADLLVGGPEHSGEDLDRQLLREGCDRKGNERRTAHREDVVQRIRRRDPAERRRIVDERREEVEREDDRTVVVELVDRCVVRGREPDEQVLGLHRNEALEQLLEPRSRVLDGAAAAGGQSGEGGHAVTVRRRRPKPPSSWGEEAAFFRHPRAECSPSAPCCLPDQQAIKDYRAAMSVGELFSLEGRSAIVTGGGAGLGQYFAEALAEAGADLVLCARKAERCEATAAALRRDLGVNAVAMACDVRDKEQVEAVVARARSEFGSVDILVNNAGTSWGAPVADYPLEGWQKVIDVNLTGLFLFSQASGREMISAGRGKIVNIALLAAFGGAPRDLMDAIAYSASNGGVVSFTRDLAVKWARHGITVTARAAGPPRRPPVSGSQRWARSTAGAPPTSQQRRSRWRSRMRGSRSPTSTGCSSTATATWTWTRGCRWRSASKT